MFFLNQVFIHLRILNHTHKGHWVYRQNSQTIPTPDQILCTLLPWDRLSHQTRRSLLAKLDAQPAPRTSMFLPPSAGITHKLMPGFFCGWQGLEFRSFWLYSKFFLLLSHILSLSCPPPPPFFKVTKGPKWFLILTFSNTHVVTGKGFENSFSLKISQHSASYSYIGFKVSVLGLSPDQRKILLKISEVDTILIRGSMEEHYVAQAGLELMSILQLHWDWD